MSRTLAAADVVAVMPYCPLARAQAYLPHMSGAMTEGEITTYNRITAFLAQLGHESADLRYMEEIASGAAYEGRRDLGNIYPGDGVRYKGRGPIQLTGRANYRAAGAALGLDLEGNPYQASKPEVGFRIAVWYWSTRSLNYYADQGRSGFDTITYRINGGYNGYNDRWAHYNRARAALPTDITVEGSGGSHVFEQVVFAAGGRADAALCHIAAAAMERLGVDATVADSENLDAAFAACQATPIGTFDFFVVGGPAKNKLPGWLGKHIHPAKDQKRERKSDYIGCVGAGYADTAKKLQEALAVFYGRDTARQYVRLGGRRVANKAWWEKGGTEVEDDSEEGGDGVNLAKYTPTNKYGLTAHADRVRQHIEEKFGPFESISGYRDPSDKTEHASRTAIDFDVGSDSAKGKRVAEYIVAHRVELDIEGIIWWAQQTGYDSYGYSSWATGWKAQYWDPYKAGWTEQMVKSRDGFHHRHDHVKCRK